MAKINRTCLEWAVAASALPGEPESGDLHFVVTTPERTLVAATDGLGHGSEAAIASRTAVETLRQFPDEPVISLLQLCHESLKPTRGAAMSLASFNCRDAMLTWIGVGNVAGFLLRAHPALQNETLLLRNGVIGDQLPPLQAAVLPVCPGDFLILATDGVRVDFTENLVIGGSPQTTADRLMARYNKGTDDALVVVVRYPGSSS